MGALHAGHLSLIARARHLAGRGGTVVVSIFVNPAQFGPNEDFARYPRPFRRDAQLCRVHGVDWLFHPAPGQMYAPDFSSYVEETDLAQRLCGRTRPGHFRGVCTVVAKLFHLLAPTAAVFGEKDFQQLAIIRRMVRDLNFPVRIVGAPIVRERDGLALSSRNQYLTEAERAQASVLRAALLAAAQSGRREPAVLRKLVIKIISGMPLAKIDYAEVIDAETLRAATRQTKKIRIAVAVFFGRTRLIDNIAL